MGKHMVLARNISADGRIYPPGTPVDQVPGGDKIDPKYLQAAEPEEPDAPEAPEVELMETKPAVRPRSKKRR